MNEAADTDQAIIFTRAHVPPVLVKSWLQHLRDFDVAHPGCHFEIMMDAPDTPLAKMVEQLTLDPALSFMEILGRKKP